MAAQVDFKPEAKERIARSMGYSGDMSKFPAFLASDPAKQHLMERYKKYAGGMVLKAANGLNVMTDEQKQALQTAQGVGQAAIDRNERGEVNQPIYQMDASKAIEDFYKQFPEYAPAPIETAPAPTPSPIETAPAPIETAPAPTPLPTPTVTLAPAPLKDASENPVVLPTSTNIDAPKPVAPPVVTPTLINADTTGAEITATTGQLDTTDPSATAAQATTPDTVTAPTVIDPTTGAERDKTGEKDTATYDATKIEEDIETKLGELKTKKLELDPRAQVDAEQQATSSVSGLDAAQGQATLIGDEAPTRTVGTDERVSGTTVDTSRVGQAFGTGEVQAASVVDELSSLMADFEGGNTPVWAKGAMRAAREDMARRGLGGSSMASQAIIQAAMQAALPIAQLEAGNKQQAALFKGEQRAKFMQMEFDQAFQTKVINAAKVENAANMQFSADQQIVLENSRLVNTMNLQNLSNKQSLVLAEASALANLDMANLNNRQQAEVINAQNFLQVDMANFNNEQQIEMFKTQQRIASLFSDQAAENASEQFNASSENQMSQFFDNLQTQVQQFNSSQKSAMEQFNTGQKNAIEQFNVQIENQRDQFNAQNELVVAQSNVQWRREVATTNTSAINRANEINVQNMLGLQTQMLSFLWQEYADNNARIHNASESSKEVGARFILQQMIGDQSAAIESDKTSSNVFALLGEAAVAAYT